MTLEKRVAVDKFDRIYDLHQILAGRRTPLPVDALMERLGCSRPSVYRLIRVLRDHLNAPIEFDRERGGYSRWCHCVRLSPFGAQ